MKRRVLLQSAPALALANCLVPRLAFGQAAYPNKTIRYIVPVSAGGGSDMVGRTLTERWGNLLKQSFIVDNQAGGGGVIASQATARADPMDTPCCKATSPPTAPARQRVNYPTTRSKTSPPSA